MQIPGASTSITSEAYSPKAARQATADLTMNTCSSFQSPDKVRVDRTGGNAVSANIGVANLAGQGFGERNHSRARS